MQQHHRRQNQRRNVFERTLFELGFEAGTLRGAFVEIGRQGAAFDRQARQQCAATDGSAMMAGQVKQAVGQRIGRRRRRLRHRRDALQLQL